MDITQVKPTCLPPEGESDSILHQLENGINKSQREMYDSIKEYDEPSALRYLTLITSREYIERKKGNDEKTKFSNLTQQQKDRIFQHLLYRDKLIGVCPTCLDPTDEPFCCGRCKQNALLVLKERGFTFRTFQKYVKETA